ncbi:hypothetical protein BOX15_Mlig034038g1, partial [Macrostomum lignano]
FRLTWLTTANKCHSELPLRTLYTNSQHSRATMGSVFSVCTQPRTGVSPGNAEAELNKSAVRPADRNVYMAIHNFVATQPDELTICRGDMIELEFTAEQCQSSQWWKARNLETNRSGLVPYNYITKYNGLPCQLSGWMDCNRMDANRMLLRAGLQAGTYIIRPCARQNAGLAKLALSVRTPDRRCENNFLVKHYQIKNSADETVFFINKSKTYPTVQKLIDEYKNGGLCSPLAEPCPTDPPTVQFKDIEVPRQTLSMVRKLGAGSFGEVWLAKWNGILDVAIKTLKPDTAMSQEKFLEEAKIMHKLSHPKIVNILGVCTKILEPNDQIYIITEFMENGALLDYLRKSNSGSSKLPMATLLDIAYQIADGMAYLEEKKFVHRDLRAANVLVGKDNFVKVADFGLARVVQDDEIYQAESLGKFPVKWTAPEAMHENRFTTKSDVWSYGVLLYEILTLGGSIYVGMSNREVMQFVKNPRNRLPVPRTPGMSRSDEEIALRIHQQYMMACWNQNPDERPTFATLRNEFEDIDKTLEQQYTGDTN